MEQLCPDERGHNFAIQKAFYTLQRAMVKTRAEARREADSEKARKADSEKAAMKPRAAGKMTRKRKRRDEDEDDESGIATGITSIKRKRGDATEEEESGDESPRVSHICHIFLIYR